MEESGLHGDVWPETRSLFAVVPGGNDHGEQRGDYLDRLVGESLSVQVVTGNAVGGTLLGWDEHAVFVQIQSGRTRLIPWTAVVWIEGTSVSRRPAATAFFDTP